MIDLAVGLAAAFGVVFLAELGDKTQLLALGFGARHPLRIVAVGLAIGYGLANLVAVVVGGLLGAALPERPVEIVSGIVFLGFAAAALWDRRGPDADVASSTIAIPSRPWRATWTIGAAIAVAEMGDKTQITTVTLASQSAPVGVWIGATLGATTSGMVGAAAGRSIGHRISDRAVSTASAVLFAAFGLAMLLGWF